MDDISHAVGKPVVIRLLLVAGVSGALIYFALSAHQPSWQGRKLSAWMNELADPNLAENGDPREAIAKIGERGIPYLLNELQAEDSPIKRTVYRFSVSQSWLPDLHYRSADERRLLASLAFGALGPKAASSCSVLTNLVLIAPSGGVRAAAAGALAEIGPFARSSTPALLVSLGDPEPNVRMASIYALTQIRGDLNSILPSLIKKLADSDAYVCRSAIGALAGFKADAHPALKSFKDHWLQFDGRNRSAAVFASARIDLKEAGPIMRLAMYDSDPRVQASFVRALSQCTNQPGIAVPFLIEFAHSTNTLLPDIQVARALANFGPEAKDAVPALLDMLKQTNSNQWAGIGEALSKIDAPAARNAGWTAQSPAAPRKRRGSP